MGIARIGGVHAAGDNHTVTTAAIDTTGANLIVIAAYGNSGTLPVSDSKNNTWVPLTLLTDPSYGVFVGRLYYCLNPAVGAGHTFTNAANWTSPKINVLVFSGVGAYETETGYADTASTGQPGSITPAEDGELLVSACVWAYGDSASVADGFTDDFQASCDLAYLIQTTKTPVNPTWTWSPYAATLHMAAFTAAAASGSPYTLTADAGTFTATGIAAALVAARRLAAEVGTFALSGQAAGLLATRRILAEAGVFGMTGQAAALLVARRLAADVGSFALAGQAAGLLAQRKLVADLGTFLLTGQAATLTYSGGAPAGPSAAIWAALFEEGED